jgi:hypothetical protein
VSATFPRKEYDTSDAHAAVSPTQKILFILVLLSVLSLTTSIQGSVRIFGLYRDEIVIVK